MRTWLILAVIAAAVGSFGLAPTAEARHGGPEPYCEILPDLFGDYC